MSRPIRIEYEGAFYHIIQRGLEKRHIFKEQKDKAKLLEYIQHVHKAYGAIFHAYCLLDNHYHFIIETPRANIKQIMHSINTSYAVFYNKRHRRVGPLFQGRYKSIVVQNDEYLWKLSSYIHNNPAKAKLVEDPEAYEWSSYSSYTGKIAKPEWLQVEFILSNFGERKARVARYREFVRANIMTDEEIRKEMKNGFIYGSVDFAKHIIETYLKGRVEEENIKEMAEIRSVLELNKRQIALVVGRHVNGYKEQKKIEIYILRKFTTKKNSEISKLYDGISAHAVSKIFTRVRDSRKTNNRINNTLNKIEKAVRQMSNV